MSHSASQISAVDGAVVAEAAEPEAKRRRLLNAGGPVEDDETARQKMRDAKVGEPGGEITGFDPRNVMKAKGWGVNSTSIIMTPMSYFSSCGDLPMMRWLYVNGADTRGLDNPHYFPMYAAATGRAMVGALRASTIEKQVKWLYFHGAAKDITRRNAAGWAPFNFLLVDRERSLIQWLILNGALCQDGNESGMLDVGIIKTSFGRASKFQLSRKRFANARKDLLEWAVELHQTRTSFFSFLCGTLSRQEGKATSPIACLGGESGITELVADYLGVIRGREARIIRQLVELLPGIYTELEDIEEGWAKAPYNPYAAAARRYRRNY